MSTKNLHEGNTAYKNTQQVNTGNTTPINPYAPGTSIIEKGMMAIGQKINDFSKEHPGRLTKATGAAIISVAGCYGIALILP